MAKDHINPMKKVNRKQTRPEKVIKRYHRPEEIRVCESALMGEERLFFRFLKFTGARLSEALCGQWDDVDYESREIVIRGTKTEESYRQLPICDGLYDTLKELEGLKNGSPLFSHHKVGKSILMRDRVKKGGQPIG